MAFNKATSKVEYEYADDIDRKEFFKMLEEKQIDLDMVSNRKKDQNEQFYKFNILVNELYYSGKMDMKTIAIFLFKDFFDDYNQVLRCFDEFNTYILKYDMAGNHHRKIEKNTLQNFMYD